MRLSSWFRTAIGAIVVSGLGYLVSAIIDIRSDLSFFQPRLPSRAAQLAIEQVRSGPASRLILLSLTNAPAPELARLSRALVDALSESSSFVRVANGTETLNEDALRFVFERRYLLGPPIGSDTFSPEKLRTSIAAALNRLGSLSGFIIGDLLPSDPTGRLGELLDDWQGSNQPYYRHGVWFSRDGSMALLIAMTSADGDDFEGQSRAQAEIEALFSGLVGNGTAVLKVTGPPVFSRHVSQSIQNQAWAIGLGSIAIVAVILLGAFRSIRALLVITLPTATAAIAGAAVVQTIFGSVHGIALTFGAVIVSVTSDYPVHLLSHTPGSASPWAAVRSIMSPLGLGAATTAVAFLPMTLSSFPGLAQLGVFASIGIAVAALMTTSVLPLLLDAQPPKDLARGVPRLLPPLSRARLPLVMAGLAAALWLAFGRGDLFSDDLSRLNPLPRDLVELDNRLRSELGAPDVRRLIVVDGSSAQDVLVKSEEVARLLDPLRTEGLLEAYDSPSRYLPSAEAQKRQQTLLPTESDLRSNLASAIYGLPIEPGTFEPFIQNVGATKSRSPVEPAELLPVPLLGDRFGSLLHNRGQDAWEAFILLSGVTSSDRLIALENALRESDAHYLDLQAESIEMIASYRAEALRWLVAGLAIVATMLFGVLRAARAVQVLTSLLVSMSITTAVLVALDQSLTPFHLVALLLVAGMGLDYALFMSRDHVDAEDRQRSVRSVVICAATTTAAFALMILSTAPILRGIGLTVGIGLILSLLCALIICGPRNRSLTAWSHWA